MAQDETGPPDERIPRSARDRHIPAGDRPDDHVRMLWMIAIGI
jgi:hypothetical protein